MSATIAYPGDYFARRDMIIDDIITCLRRYEHDNDPRTRSDTLDTLDILLDVLRDNDKERKTE